MLTLILVADASRARFFQKDEAGVMKLLRNIDRPRGRAHEQDLRTDQPGRVIKAGVGNVHSSMGPHHTAHEVEEGQFATELARTLSEAIGQHKADQLALIAPPHMLGMIRHHLSPIAARATGFEMPRDYTFMSDNDLRAALEKLTIPNLMAVP